MNSKSFEKEINLFYTGGWDSTYRFLELSKKEIIIQLIYCCDKDRRSIEKEKETIEKIRQAVIENSTTKASINPIKYVDVDLIQENVEITKAYNNILGQVHVGSQYEWLAKYVAEHKIIAELGIEKPNGEYSGCCDLIEKFGALKKLNDSYVLDMAKSTNDCILLLGGFSFPIINITELEMIENIKLWGNENIMKMIWFCHRPVNDTPCGCCRPCQQKMECGMQFLLPKSAKVRYHIYKKVQALKYVIKKLMK